MAGSAGTLEIELIADIAKLKQDMREMERTVGAANDNIERSTRRGGGAFRPWSQGVKAAGQSSQLAGHHMANLSFQLQDIAIGLEGGQKPLTVFLQQGSQIGQIMMQSGVGIGGMVKSVGQLVGRLALANPYITAAVVAAGALTLGMRELGQSLNEEADLENYAKSLGLTADEMKELSSTNVTLGDSFRGLWQTILDSSQIDENLGELWGKFKSAAGDAFSWLWEASKTAAAGLYAAFAGSVEAVRIIYRSGMGAVAEQLVNLANVGLSVLEDMINTWVARINVLIDGVNFISPFEDVPRLASASFGRIENQWAGTTANMGSELANAYSSAFQTAEEFMADFGQRLGANIVGAARDRIQEEAQALISERNDAARRQRAQRLSEEEKALRKAKEAADQYLENLERETATLGMNSIELKQYEINAAAAAAAAAGLADEAQRINEAGAVLIQRMRDQAQARWEESIQSIEDEIAVMHLVGRERELAALQLEKEAYQARLTAQGIQDVEAAWERYLEVRTRQINLASQLEKDKEAADRLNESLRNIVGTLGEMGGFGGFLSDLIGGLQSGNFAGMGPLGDIFTVLTDKSGGWGKAIDNMSKTMQETFGIGGALSQTLSKGLMGAAIGSAASSVVFGSGQSKTGQMGSSIGGALGGMLTASSFGGALSFLGSAAGPIGAIAGSLLGGVIGGMLAKTKRASVNIGGSGGSLTATARSGYNTSELLANSQKAAGGVIGMVNDIASALGGTVNASAGRVSIGQRKGNWVVDSAGTGKTKGAGTKNFGEDAEAAIAYAIQNLIQDGVIEGLRQSTMNLLKKGGDLEAQLEKAMAFEAVFKELEAAANPFKNSLDQLAAEFDKLKGIFDEAGATAEEYGKLNELLTRRQMELIESAMSSYRSTFYTDEQNLAAAQQKIRSTLDPLGFSTVDTVAEFMALVEMTDALTDPELFGALMELVDEFGLIKEASQSAADAARAEAEAKQALVEEQRRQLEADIASTKATLRSMYDAQRRELEGTADQFRAFASSLRDFRATLFGVEGSTNAYNKALSDLRRVGGLASLGDASALGQLQGVSSAFLEAAMGRAGSREDYLRDVAKVASYVDAAITASDNMVSETEQQLSLLTEQVSQLIDLNEGVETIAEVMTRLEELLATTIPDAPAYIEPAMEAVEIVREQMAAMAEDMHVVQDTNIAMANTISRMESFWQRLSPDGLGITIRTDSDTPIQVQTV